MRRVVEVAAGSVAVYVLVAACSAGGGTLASSASTTGGATSAGGYGGSVADGTAGTTGSGGLSSVDAALDAIADAVVDPVPDAAADTNESGTRLRARYWTGSDGSRQFIGWRDTGRNEDCAVGTASDGQLRCLPTLSTGCSGTVATGMWAGYVYSDASCTIPAVAVNAESASTVQYVTSGASDSSTGCTRYVTTVYSVGDRAASVYTLSGATCSAYPMSSAYVAFNLGAEVAPSSLVAMTETVE
jgi:hypothetical protein